MILNVPYQSQIPYEEGVGKRKWCGLVSLWMVMAYYLKDQAPKIEVLLEKYGPEFEFGGFEHKALLKIAREYGLSGFRKSWWAQPGVQGLIEKFQLEEESKEEISEWLETNTEESLFTLEEYIKKSTPVILSVTPEFSPSQATHLVVLVGVENNDLVIHDPLNKGENFKISKGEFRKYWLRQAVIIKPTK